MPGRLAAACVTAEILPSPGFREVIERMVDMAVADLVVAANGGVPLNNLKPHNCHEAALGWVLMAKYPTLRNVDPLSHGAPKAWMTLRSLSERYGTGAPKQLTGAWMGQHIYSRGIMRVRPPLSAASFLVGDVILMGTRQAPHHSMVVVQKLGNQVLARGFNNAGAFGGPYLGWDATLRDLADPTRWDQRGNFMGNNGPAEIHSLTYNAICANIPDNMNF